MMNNRTPVITIAGVKDNPNRFVQMVSDQYGKQVELRIANDLFPAKNSAVEDILNSIGKPEPAFR